MKRLNTLKLNYEFKNVFNKGKYYIGNQVIIYILKNKYQDNRLGIALSSKLCNAVKRNRIKRVIRAAYQKNINNCINKAIINKIIIHNPFKKFFIASPNLL